MAEKTVMNDVLQPNYRSNLSFLELVCKYIISTWSVAQVKQNIENGRLDIFNYGRCDSIITGDKVVVLEVPTKSKDDLFLGY